MTHTPPQSHDSEKSHAKSRLYCWDCTHESPPDGDWVRHTQGSVVTYDCPTCGTTIAKRPRSTETDTDDRHHQTVWGRVVHSSIGLWRAGVDASVAGVTALTPRLR